MREHWGLGERSSDVQNGSGLKMVARAVRGWADRVSIVAIITKLEIGAARLQRHAMDGRVRD